MFLYKYLIAAAVTVEAGKRRGGKHRKGKKEKGLKNQRSRTKYNQSAVLLPNDSIGGTGPIAFLKQALFDPPVEDEPTQDNTVYEYDVNQQTYDDVQTPTILSNDVAEYVDVAEYSYDQDDKKNEVEVTLNSDERDEKQSGAEEDDVVGAEGDDVLGIQPRAWWDDWLNDQNDEEELGKSGEYEYYLEGTTTTSTTTTTTTTTTTLFPPMGRSLGGSCIACYGSGSTTAETRQACIDSQTIESCEAVSDTQQPVCAVEVIKKRGEIVSFITKCAERESCIDNQKQNFGTSLPYHTQCRPEDGLTRRGGVSICRQCALTCDVNDFSLCFSAETGFPTTGGNGVAFDILGDAPCGSGGCTYGRKFYDADLLGAPTDADGQQMLDENNIRFGELGCLESPLVTSVDQCKNVVFNPWYRGYDVNVSHMT